MVQRLYLTALDAGEPFEGLVAVQEAPINAGDGQRDCALGEDALVVDAADREQLIGRFRKWRRRRSDGRVRCGLGVVVAAAGAGQVGLVDDAVRFGDGFEQLLVLEIQRCGLGLQLLDVLRDRDESRELVGLELYVRRFQHIPQLRNLLGDLVRALLFADVAILPAPVVVARALAFMQRGGQRGAGSLAREGGRGVGDNAL
mmetsp:Transcript_17560/g.49583  ORF Transcript_17560/g.49583 Transcript_17560/m.49583 type:complete len:201 (+) Transcript_17560:1145-1747(+)